jgi:threonine synthase
MMGLPIARLVLATNENDVLDEFFRTGVYRPRTSVETSITSSPSMDISRASNFERFMFDAVGRDSGIIRNGWGALDEKVLDMLFFPGSPNVLRTQFGFVSGSSTHADRLATIRDVWERHGTMIDPHTADGVKVAREHRELGVPMVVMETAKPVKFTDMIRKALSRDPLRPEDFEGIEDLPQRVEVMDADPEAVKRFIAKHA